MKIKSQFICQSCGTNTPKWQGRCNGCGEWNTLLEEQINGPTSAKSLSSGLGALREEFQSDTDAPDWEVLGDSSGRDQEASAARTMTGIGELDRVLGGGLVSDSFILLGGDPGIGKSTLLLQVANGLAGKDKKVFYASGEESVGQVRMRAKRLGIQAASKKDVTKASKNVFLAAETSLEKVFASAKEIQPDVLMIDSLQTFSSGHIDSAPGSVSQVREVASRLMTFAKTAKISVWLIGHVTKEGSIAGPKTVEHMVDTVLYFEGESGQNYRLLRTVKNRFGNAKELGVFEMVEEGLEEVTNPSSLFLNEHRSPVSGTAIGTSLEGTRPLLVEVQALVAPSPLAMPRRTSVGMDSARIALIGAILERHLNVSLGQKDLFFNVAGGLKLSEPACDLAAAAAIWSSVEETPLSPDWIFIGEIGLTGEVRRIPQPEIRVEEAKKLGFKTVFIPRAVADKLKSAKGLQDGIKLVSIENIKELAHAIRAES